MSINGVTLFMDAPYYIYVEDVDFYMDYSIFSGCNINKSQTFLNDEIKTSLIHAEMFRKYIIFCNKDVLPDASKVIYVEKC